MLHSQYLSTNLMNALLTGKCTPSPFPKILQRTITLVALSALPFAAQRGYCDGIAAPQQAPSSTTTPEKQECDGQQQAPKRSNGTGNSNSSAAANSNSTKTDGQQSGISDGKLRLSTKAASEESADPQGQFCKRDRGEHGAWHPSATVAAPDATNPPSPPNPPSPISEFSNGKLTIRANGEDFAAVLDAVKSTTGIKIEMPAESESERVFMNIGPVPMQDALMALLEGSKFNYLIVGSREHPGLPTRLILTMRQGSDAASMVASTQQPTQEMPAGTLYGAQGSQEDAQAQTPVEPQQLPVPAQPTAIPSSIPVGVNVQQMAVDSNKSPGQILDELQKRQQQTLDDQAAQQSPQ
jgi:hypothetical protein